VTTLTATPAGRRSRARRWAAAWAGLLELLAVLGAMALLWPSFERVAQFGEGRDRRFADTGLRVDGLPDLVLPGACRAFGAMAVVPVRQRLCESAAAAPGAVPQGMPPALSQAASRAAQAFEVPVFQAQARLDALRLRQREGVGELRASADAIAAIEADLRPYVDRFQLTGADGVGPLPLHCALRWAEAALAEPATSHTARVHTVLLLAAALDGRAATGAVAAQAPLPSPGVHAKRCNGDGTAALSAAAALMGDARQLHSNARKNEAMRALLQTAGLQWMGAMGLGLVFLKWSRRAVSPATGCAVALAAWAAAAWAARVPWPLAGKHAFEPGRLELSWSSAPAGFVGWLCLLAGLCLMLALGRRRDRAALVAPQSMSSRVGDAGLVLATGLGWLLLLDLSAHGHPVNRYLALYHQGHLWLGMLVFSLFVFLRRPLSRGLGRVLSSLGEGSRRIARRLGSAGAALLLLIGAAAAVLLFGVGLANMRQLTSELGRVWLIVGAAWFFFLRATPLAERLAQAPASVSLWRYAWPLLLVVGVLVGAMVVTRDMGPLLIAGYAGGAFVAATVALWWHQRGGASGWAMVLAMGLFALWIVAVTAALFRAGSVDAVTAARLESLATPLASTNDQLALVSWFQRAAPPQGFGLGAVPWCGYAPAGSCSGVPAQVHSDYTFTAIVGVFGASAAWMAALGGALWLHRLVRHHGRVTQGEPRFNDHQALLSWVSVGWAVLASCQLAVTVAGNLAVLPLTGVTFPFVSYGMTSLVVNLAFLALCLNVDVPARGHDE
jgi:cell division protein FtsW (lipid II flippase)